MLKWHRPIYYGVEQHLPHCSYCCCGALEQDTQHKQKIKLKTDTYVVDCVFVVEGTAQ